ncbi:ACT domain-containing protein [Treponema rectale]|uniref:Aspartokinase n=1 Tax=Treponema rectale TaxID=744512 RepID=A0A840SEI4_9SPIR|nr:aspartate kinase [Treponema rectale]MBB5217851.1 aspartate kinase [Treponema rectale]QOS40424.1 ACT domain-containing protein [Treponema rectale]
MIVMKFGGSSVANAERIRHVAGIIQAYKDKLPVVVLSAMGDTTDHLLDAADMAVKGTVDIKKVEELHLATAKELDIEVPAIKELLEELKFLLTGISMLHELTKRTRDYLVSFGERMSVRMMAAYLSKQGTPAQFYDAWDIGMVSDSNYMSAELLDDVWTTIPQHLNGYKNGSDKKIPIVTGFIAKDKNGIITTLGRGGSDLSATMIGAAMQADEIQTWKDVDGILTTDPRVVSEAHPVPEVTYEEAQELAMFGAQVLHPRSMIPCRKTGTPVRVKNSYNIDSPGSIIVEKHSGERPLVTAITSVKNVALIDIQSSRMLGAAGFLAHVFNQFLKWNISVDVIATSEVSISLTVNGKVDLTGLIEDVKNVADITVKTNKAIVTIICDASRSSGILAKAFAALEKEGINVQMISQGASKVNISVIVDTAQVEKTVQVLHKALF